MICSLSAAETQSNLTSSDSIIASVTWSNPDTTNVTRVLAEVERLHGESAALSGLASGSLSIVTGDVIACRLLAPRLGHFACEHPGVRLRVWNRTSSETTALVREGRADLGIVTLPVDKMEKLESV